MKQIFSILFLCFSITSVFSQSNPSQYSDEVSRIFQNVDQSQATTGFLMPKALYMIDFENYDGTTLTSTNKVTDAKIGNLYTMLHMVETSNSSSLPQPSYFNNYNIGGGQPADFSYRSNLQ
jgi:hypothetical protein